MSNNRDNYWDDDEEEDTETDLYTSDTDLVKKLRKALKAEQKRNKELESTLGEMSKSQRERILKDVFTSRGVNPKVAAFVPSDLEASEEAIASWIENNADVFGIQTEKKAEISQQDVAALRQIDSVTQGALSPDKSEDLAYRINNANTQDEILKLIYGSQS